MTLTVTATVRSSLRIAGLALSSSAAARRRLVAAVRDGESPAELLGELRDEALGEARRVLGVADIEERLGRDAARSDEDEQVDPSSLRERGADLLGRSADVAGDPEEPHPAFALILEQLAPDEARILRLLASAGPQPVVDVYEVSALRQEKGEAARRVSLVGRHAGCRHPDRADAYLDNLMRLGLLRIALDPVEDDDAYEVLEAQPEVERATGPSPGPGLRTRVDRRALVLTHFGSTFCETCLPIEGRSPAPGRDRMLRS